MTDTEIPEHIQATNEVLDLVSAGHDISSRLVARASVIRSTYFKMEDWIISKGYEKMVYNLEVWYLSSKNKKERLQNLSLRNGVRRMTAAKNSKLRLTGTARLGVHASLICFEMAVFVLKK